MRRVYLVYTVRTACTRLVYRVHTVCTHTVRGEHTHSAHTPCVHAVCAHKVYTVCSQCALAWPVSPIRSSRLCTRSHECAHAWPRRRAAAHKKAEGEGDSAAHAAVVAAWGEMQSVLANANFLKLAAGFSVGTGTVWALLMLEQQVITPCG